MQLGHARRSWNPEPRFERSSITKFKILIQHQHHRAYKLRVSYILSWIKLILNEIPDHACILNKESIFPVYLTCAILHRQFLMLDVEINVEYKKYMDKHGTKPMHFSVLLSQGRRIKIFCKPTVLLNALYTSKYWEIFTCGYFVLTLHPCAWRGYFLKFLDVGLSFTLVLCIYLGVSIYRTIYLYS